MFGLTIEKLVVVALLAAVVIGPRRLPVYASRVAALVRRLAVRASDAARRAENETGIAALRDDWTTLDPRQYDPRRIIREAWAASGAGGGVAATPGDRDAASGPASTILERHVEGEWVAAGSSGHPRRVWVPAE